MSIIQPEKKLTKNDLTIGIKVKASQLSDILDTYIILTNVHLVRDNFGIGTFEGTIDNISDELITLTKPNSILIYNDSYERETCCEYE
jgi:hypothetical protein